MTISATISLTQTDLNEAVKAWLGEKGISTTDRFTVVVKTIPGDRPFDSEHTRVTVYGVAFGGKATP